MCKPRGKSVKVGLDEMPQVFRLKHDAKAVCGPDEVVVRVELREVRGKHENAL